MCRTKTQCNLQCLFEPANTINNVFCDFDYAVGHGWKEGWLSLPKRFFSSVTPGDPNDPELKAQLPKLPVPDLEQTMGRYLDNLKPLLSENQFENVRIMVQAFADPDGPGPKVQQELIKRQQEMINWAYDWWINDMYLAQRICLPVNVNPGFLLPVRQFKGYGDVARHSARLVTAACKIKDLMDRRELVTERATSREKGQPLCMAQNYRVFSYCRIPGRGEDVLRSLEPEGPPRRRHIILACRNKFYALHLRSDDPEDQGLSEEAIAGHILHVLEKGAEDATPLSALTSERRDSWADHREQLLQFEDNRESMRLIEESMIMLCLDVKPLGSEFNRRGNRGGRGLTVGQRDETNMEHHMIHGGGSRYNSLNRWFDKTLEFVIGVDGVNGLCLEHSPAEGVAVVQIVDEMLEACSDLTPSNETLPVLHTAALQELKWVKPAGFHRVISDATKSLDNLIEDLDLFIYRFEGYGKNFIKSCKVSPDAYLQLALQLAYYKLYGRLTATYESASTRRFMLGRVDCIRSATWEALQWVSAVTQGDENGDPLHPAKRVTFSLITEKEKLELFDTAMKKQTEIMVDNILGQGIDIHLLGLREQSKLMNMPLDLFEDESYKIANHFALSTSQVAMKMGFGGYGPVVPDGYGACYNILNDSVIFSLSAFYSSELTSTSRFAQSLEESLTAMQILLQPRVSQSK